MSTAESELGVVIAHSDAGNYNLHYARVHNVFTSLKFISHPFSFAGVPMIPISWTEMQCPKTHNKEPRKVARIVPENAPV